MRFDLALLTMLCWGLAMFLPKVAGRHLSPSGVVLANFFGYVVCLPYVLATLAPGDRRPQGSYLVGLSMGVMFIVGNLAFYRLLQTEAVARLVPLTALYIAIPAVLGVTLLRERLSLAQWCGVGLAILAGYLLALEPREKPLPPAPGAAVPDAQAAPGGAPVRE